MRRFLLLLFLFLILVSTAQAQDEDGGGTLLPGAKDEYRFDYKGDRTQIEVVVEAPDGVTVEVYPPGATEPVGKGSRKGNELHWTGKANSGGAYRLIIENKTPGPIVYSMVVLGQGVSGVGRVIPDQQPASANASTQGGRVTLNVSLPTGARKFTSPVVPTNCTPANALPQVISASLKLCPNEIYPPLRIVGNGIGLFADDARSAVINSAGRMFAVNLDGGNNWIDGVTIQSAPDPADAGAFLCQYDSCEFPTQPDKTVIQGSLAYGGGILVNGSNTVIHNVKVRGGTIGVATVNGTNNALVDNDLSDLNGWGSYNLRSSNSVFVGNRFERDDHGCTTPDGRKFKSGCETSGWVCLQCNNNLIARNHCVASGNCYYMSGERGLGSHNNRFIGNYCAASPNNCFEITFSKGNVLQDNIATADPQTGAACKYPFWIGGSTVYFGKNTWGCMISPQDSLAHAIASTEVPTVALTLGASNPPVVSTKPAPAPTKIAPKPQTAPLLPPCPRGDRPIDLFNWNGLAEWVACMSVSVAR
ncbi:MAG TPA: right-handed parallel beta-helix repeat-containing protein [Anaerolineae bacterium]|nr:right-handed parallel beta-helix repeat-containing protein [Anaerolineae bacterium]